MLRNSEEKNYEHKEFLENNMNINSGDNSYEKSEDISNMMTSLNFKENTNNAPLNNSNVVSNLNSQNYEYK